MQFLKTPTFRAPARMEILMHVDAVLESKGRSFMDKNLLALARLISYQLPNMKHEYITEAMMNLEFGSLLAFVDKEIVGGCVFRPHVDFLEVYLLAVSGDK